MTLEDYFLERGLPSSDPVDCESCGLLFPPFALRHARGNKGICVTCITDAERESALPHQLNWDDVRARRNAMLAQTDWTQLPDVDIETSDKYKAIRKELRDAPEKLSSPEKAMEWLNDLKP